MYFLHYKLHKHHDESMKFQKWGDEHPIMHSDHGCIIVGQHSSYPDFIIKDKFGRKHIFAVKSVNQSAGFTFDSNMYILLRSQN